MAIDSMVQRLLKERDGKLALVDQIASVADEAGRDLYETEQSTIGEAQERVRSLNVQIDRLTQDLELSQNARSRIRTLDPSIIAADFTPVAVEDEAIGAVPAFNHIQTLMNFDPNRLVHQVMAQEHGLDGTSQL